MLKSQLIPLKLYSSQLNLAFSRLNLGLLFCKGIICCISRMNELNWFFACSCMVPGKLKVILGMHMVRYCCDLVGVGTLKSALCELKNKSINWADFLHAGSDRIIFGLAINHAQFLWLLNTGAPLQLHYTVVVTC